MSGRRSIVSVRMWEPSLRASAAGIASSKNIQICPPFPDRDRSRAAGTSVRRARFEDCPRVFLPVDLVKVNRKEEAGFVQ